MPENLLRTSDPMPGAAEYTMRFEESTTSATKHWRFLEVEFWRSQVYPECYCTQCKSRLPSALVGTSARCCMICGTIDSPNEVLPSDGVLRIAKSELIDFSDPFVLLKSLLYLAILDRIDKLLLQPGMSDYKYIVFLDGQSHNMEPPPPRMHRQIIAIAHCLWDCADDHHSQTSQNRRVVVGDDVVAWTTASFESTDAGEELTIKFEYDS